MSKVPVLFDVNAGFGKQSAGTPEFPALRDRLEFMDRFGIARAVAWNVESTQNHAGAGNEALADQIYATPGARGRIIPAFAVSGLMPYESGGVDALAARMEASGTRALRFVNVFRHLTLQQLEPVILAIRQRKPFIVMRHDEATAEDLLAFTNRFPDLSVVLTEVSWGHCIKVFDLMRQRKNILADNSWLHTNDGIELVVKHFGADRLVFGTGYKSHNGAAIAALARADITEDQRRLIACGNLERLTGLPPCSPAPAAVPEGNTLWPRFLEGKPLDVDTVDAHGHLGPSGGYVLEAQTERDQLALGLKQMDATGINLMLSSGIQALMRGPVEGNALLEAALTPVVDRFRGYLVFNPGYADELVPGLDRAFAGPVFIGFKTLCDYWGVPITDPRFVPMWEYANRHRLPVLNHTWNGANDSPSMFRSLVTRYPDVQFILGHSGGGDPGRREAEELARGHENVFLEWCGSFCSTLRWEETLKTVPFRQVVFGTDAMCHGIPWELGRLLSLDAPDETLVSILGVNMRRILALRRRN